MFLIVYVVIVHCSKHSNDYDFMKWILLKKFTGCIMYSLEKQPIVMLKATVIE
jgi:hypothetical protein